ncbi:MAG: hypothetical protein EOO53_12210 [Gammaproteobacteria bacterium]|nr:MAG: hypothetical protein EOO53_12210 [Gammaproteobacteria bacterium]
MYDRNSCQCEHDDQCKFVIQVV